MMKTTMRKFAAFALSLSAIAGFVPAGSTVSAETVEFVQPEMKADATVMAGLATLKVQGISPKIHTVTTGKVDAGFSGQWTSSFLQAIRNGQNKLVYTGDVAAAKKSLSELVSYYCAMGNTVQFYVCDDASGTYLELTEQYWNAVKDAVAKADAGWKAYENKVTQACYSLNLDTTDADLVDQINAYICANYDYQVTNSSMPVFIETGKGQCFHYAKMFADMCNTLGIYARKVETTEHAWNEVTVDGKTYVFDPTYNDTGNNWTAYSWRPVGSSASAARANTNGWVKQNGSWMFFKNGASVVSSWVKDGNKWYYLKSNGIMATNMWIGDCYVNGSGEWVE